MTTLLQRHDRTKAGYVRPRRSGLGDAALQQVFDTLCFLAKREDSSSFDLGALRRLAGEAIRRSGHSADASKVLDDIMGITCLILEEGGECRFLHKSVQEYHAACFVRDQVDEVAAKFYSAMETRWRSWKEELFFLSQIDRYRFLRYFGLNELRSCVPAESGGDATAEFVRSTFGGNKFIVENERIEGWYIGGSHRWHLAKALERYPGHEIELLSAGAAEFASIVRQDDQFGRAFSVEDSIRTGVGRDLVLKLFQPLLQDLRSRLVEAVAYVEAEEAKRELFEF